MSVLSDCTQGNCLRVHTAVREEKTCSSDRLWVRDGGSEAGNM